MKIIYNKIIIHLIILIHTVSSPLKMGLPCIDSSAQSFAASRMKQVMFKMNIEYDVLECHYRFFVCNLIFPIITIFFYMFNLRYKTDPAGKKILLITLLVLLYHQQHRCQDHLTPFPG